MSSGKAKRLQYLKVDEVASVKGLVGGKYDSPRRRHSRSTSPFSGGMLDAESSSLGTGIRRNPSASSLTISRTTYEVATSNPGGSDHQEKLHRSQDNLCFIYKRSPNHNHTDELHEVYRPRAYTDVLPQARGRREQHVPIINVPELVSDDADEEEAEALNALSVGRHHSVSSSNSMNALSSLIKQTLRVTTASVGLKAASSTDGLTQQTVKPLEKDVHRRFSRSTNSVSTLAYGTAATNDNSMAPLQSHVEAQSVGELNATAATITTSTTATTSASSSKRLPFAQQLSVPTTTAQQSSSGSASDTYYSHNNTNRDRPLKHSASAVGFLAPTVATTSTGSLRSASPTSRKSVSSSGSNTAKHEQQSQTAAAAAANATSAPAPAGTASSGSNNSSNTALALSGGTGGASPPSVIATTEKEKKPKEVSSSRVKKFHRHFSQVSKDEKLINYYSCALVSDILLQGHLYITDQHFAFYSNVFGYVTKVVIPTSSVTKISKEKTAKIIPNAVGVATADERHVFGSFISREAAYRLMCSVCFTPLVPAEILPKVPADIEISEEFSIEDDSSCSISGNESPPQPQGAVNTGGGHVVPGMTLGEGQTLLRRSVVSSSLSNGTGDRTLTATDKQQRHSDIPANAKTAISSASNARTNALQPNAHYNASGNPIGTNATNNTITPTSASSSTPSSPSSSTLSSAATAIMGGGGPTQTAKQSLIASFKSLSRSALLRLKFPTDLNVVYLGVLLSLLLALFSIFLLYRIVNIEAKTSLYHTTADFNWRSGNDEEIFAEALRWHRELQAKNTEEAQNILNSNLEQIAKVRRSLETLSMLIHDRSSADDSGGGGGVNVQRDGSD